MHRRTTGLTGLLAVVLLVVGGAAPAALADGQDRATGLTGTVVGDQLQLTWSRAPRDLTAQGIEWGLVPQAVRWGTDLDPSAASTTIDLGSPAFLGGRQYAFAISSMFRDGVEPEQQTISDSVVITVPSRAPRIDLKRPSCRVDQKHLTLAVRVPAARTAGDGERWTVTGRTLEVLREGRRFATRFLPGRAPAEATFELKWWSRRKPRELGMAYTVRYRLETPAGPSWNSEECSTGLSAPQPQRPALTSSFSAGRITTTWTKAHSPVVPVTKYEIRWEVGHTMHRRVVRNTAPRTLTVAVGSAKRFAVDVYESNALGGRSYNGVVWWKHGSRWTPYITYRVG